MRHGLVLVALLLPLGGCYEPQSDPAYGYAQAGYPPGYGDPGYGNPGYGGPGYGGGPPPGYPPGYAADPYAGIYPGYSYNNGAPTIIEEGAPVPLVLLGGEWGYYDHERHWHHAPDEVSRHLEQQQRGGAAFYPGGPHHDGDRQGRPPPGGDPNRGQPSFFHSAAPGPNPQPPGGDRGQSSFFHPVAPAPAPQPRPAPPPGGDPNRGQPSFFHPVNQPNAAPAPSPRPPPPPQPAHEDHGSRGCPPGQRC